MRILALDLGTKTGWATNCPQESGVQEFLLNRGESPGMRYIRFRAWLEEMIEIVKPDVIVYEQTHMRGGYATELAHGFSTRVQEICAKYGIEHAAVHSATLKKFATGSGRAKKEDMIKAAHTKLGVSKRIDDNEADALWLLKWGIENLVTKGVKVKK